MDEPMHGEVAHRPLVALRPVAGEPVRRDGTMMVAKMLLLLMMRMRMRMKTDDAFD